MKYVSRTQGHTGIGIQIFSPSLLLTHLLTFPPTLSPAQSPQVSSFLRSTGHVPFHDNVPNSSNLGAIRLRILQ